MKRPEWHDGLMVNQEVIGRRHGKVEWTLALKAGVKRTVHKRQADFNVGFLHDTVWGIY